ncbi:hypothetical protein PWT90_04942 [Aphanocladium album]|nr:hypothetical protein PWT90_04942 [Aphanocladium album]
MYLSGASGVASEEYANEDDQDIDPLRSSRGMRSNQPQVHRSGFSHGTADTAITVPPLNPENDHGTDYPGSKLALSATLGATTATTGDVAPASDVNLDDAETRDPDQPWTDFLSKTQSLARVSQAAERDGVAAGGSQETEELTSDLGKLDLSDG